jgi:hypothetical protein
LVEGEEAAFFVELPLTPASEPESSSGMNERLAGSQTDLSRQHV